MKDFAINFIKGLDVIAYDVDYINEALDFNKHLIEKLNIGKSYSEIIAKGYSNQIDKIEKEEMPSFNEQKKKNFNRLKSVNNDVKKYLKEYDKIVKNYKEIEESFKKMIEYRKNELSMMEDTKELLLKHNIITKEEIDNIWE